MYLNVYRKLYHVRPVTQGDVYRAEAKDIPRIFQVRLRSEQYENSLEFLLVEYHYTVSIVDLIIAQAELTFSGQIFLLTLGQ